MRRSRHRWADLHDERLLEPEVNTTTLLTSLIGREEYQEQFVPEQLGGAYVHVSTRFPADCRREWGDFTVVGGAEAGYADTGINVI